MIETVKKAGWFGLGFAIWALSVVLSLALFGFTVWVSLFVAGFIWGFLFGA